MNFCLIQCAWLSWLIGWLFYSISLLFSWIEFQTIQFSISLVFLFTQLNVKTVLFQTIQFSISTHYNSIWPIDRTLSCASTPGQSGPGSDSNEQVLHIPQSSSITGTSPPDCLVSYPGHSLKREVLPLCREAISGFYSSVQMGKVLSQAIPSSSASMSKVSNKLWQNEKDSLWNQINIFCLRSSVKMQVILVTLDLW